MISSFIRQADTEECSGTPGDAKALAHDDNSNFEMDYKEACRVLHRQWTNYRIGVRHVRQKKRATQSRRSRGSGKKNVYDHQASIADFDVFNMLGEFSSELQKSTTVPGLAPVANALIAAILLVTNMRDCKSVTGMASAVGLLVHGRYGTQICEFIAKSVCSVNLSMEGVWDTLTTTVAKRLESDVDDGEITWAEYWKLYEQHHPGELSEQDKNDIEYGRKKLPYDKQNGILDVVTNWRMACKSPLFKSLNRVMSMVMALALGTSEGVDLGIGNLSLFSVAAYKTQVGALDFVEAMISTVQLFYDTALMAFKTRSLRPFLYSDVKMTELDHDYFKLEQQVGQALQGNWYLTGDKPVSASDLVVACDKLIIGLGALKDVSSDKETSLKVTANMRISKLIDWKMSLLACAVGGELRIAPYTFLIYGASGLGKATISNLAASSLLLANGEPNDDNFIKILNPADKFYSTYRSDTKAIIYDDMGAGSAALSQVDHAHSWIVMSNNVGGYATKADVADKGKIAFNHIIQIGTSNFSNGGMDALSNYPVASARRGTRDHFVLKPEFRGVNGMIDGEKVKAQFPVGHFPDIYDITIYQALEKPRTQGQYELIPVRSHITYAEWINYHIEKSREHFAAQREIVAKAKEKGNKPTLCEKCKNLSDFCACAPTVPQEEKKVDPPPKWTELRYWTWKGKKTDEVIDIVDMQLQYAALIREAEDQSQSIDDLIHNMPQPQVKKVSFFRRLFWWLNFKYLFFFIMVYFFQVELKNISRELFFRPAMEMGYKPVDYEPGLIAGNLPYIVLAIIMKVATVFGYRPIYSPQAGQLIRYNGKRTPTEIVNIFMMCDKFGLSRFASLPSWFLNWWIVEVVVTVFFMYNSPLSQIFFLCISGIITLFTVLIILIWYQNMWFALIVLSILLVACMFLFLVSMSIRARAAKSLETMQFFTEYAYYARLHYQKMLVGGVAIATVIAGLAIFRAGWKHRNLYTPQGNLAPTSYEEVAERDAQANRWLKDFKVSKLPSQSASSTITVEHLKNNIAKNLFFIKGIKADGRILCSNAFMVQKGWLVLPTHILRDEPIKYKLSCNGDMAGGQLTVVASLSSAISIGSTDFSLVFVSSCPDRKDLSPYISTGVAQGAKAMMFHKQLDGLLSETTPMAANPGIITLRTGPEQSVYMYTLPYLSFEGLCGSVLVSWAKQPCILGLHSAGITNTREGAANPLVLSDFIEARNKYLETFTSAIPLMPSSPMPPKIFEKQVLESEELHEKSPARFLLLEEDGVPQCNHIEVYGSCSGRCKHYSEIRPSPVAPLVEKHFVGTEDYTTNIYSGPNFSLARKIWANTFRKMANPNWGCEQTVLQKAYDDYLYTVTSNSFFVELLKKAQPLDDDSNINGIDGVKFIDKLNRTSSTGFPLRVPKHKFLTPTGDGERQRFLEPFEGGIDFFAEVARAEKVYINGERNNFIFHACMKDEVKKRTSEKIRIFEAAPIVLQLLIRKYFLPIARVLSIFPLASECSVGIDCGSDEWDQLYKHVTRFGTKRLIAGDYTNYDLNIASQFTFAAFRILISLAARSPHYCGLGENVFKIMCGIANDVCHPYVAFNGDLIQIFGSNPSGQNMTVYINCLVNSLYHRVCFFKRYPERRFADAVALQTYGDDCFSSVSEECPNFNFNTFREDLGEMGVILTPADKVLLDKYPDYQSVENCDYLKRKNFFHPDLKYNVGVLAHESLLKMLYCYTPSKTVLPSEQIVSTFQSALNEYFFYGKDVFVDRQKRLLAILDEAGSMYHYAGTTLTDSYEMFVLRKSDIIQTPPRDEDTVSDSGSH